MANIFSVLKYHWRALNIVRKYDISYEHTHWTTPGVRYPNREFNHSAYKLTAQGKSTTVVAIREYSESLECPESPYEYGKYPYSYITSIYRQVPNTEAVIGHHEMDTWFANRIYHKMLREYRKNQYKKMK